MSVLAFELPATHAAEIVAAVCEPIFERRRQARRAGICSAGRRPSWIATLPALVVTAPAWGPGLCAVGLAAAGGICLAVPMTAGGLAWRAAGWLRGKR